MFVQDVFVSPTSVSTALAMVCEGAKGSTRDEMTRVLGYQPDDTERRTYFKDAMGRMDKDDVYTLKAVNAVVHEGNVYLMPSEQFVRHCQRVYSSQ